MFQLSCRTGSLSRPTRSRCQMTGVSNERIVLNFTRRSKVTMLRLPVEETKRPISGSTVPMVTLPACSGQKETHSVDNIQVTDNPPVAARRNISEFCRCRNRRLLGRRSVSFTRIAAAATAGGLAPRRFLVERTEVPEQSITTYRTRERTRVMVLAPKLRHEQRSEVPEHKQTPC